MARLLTLETRLAELEDESNEAVNLPSGGPPALPSPFSVAQSQVDPVSGWFAQITGAESGGAYPWTEVKFDTTVPGFTTAAFARQKTSATWAPVYEANGETLNNGDIVRIFRATTRTGERVNACTLVVGGGSVPSIDIYTVYNTSIDGAAETFYQDIAYIRVQALHGVIEDQIVHTGAECS